MHSAALDTQLFMKMPIHCDETGSNGIVYFKDVQPHPLTLDDWLDFSDSKGLKIKIAGVVAGKPEWDKTFPPVGNRFQADFAVGPSLKNSCYALVKGGWVPIFYAFSQGNIIADRNLVSEIKARFLNGEMSSGTMPNDFLDYICDKSCSCTLHTISYSLESNERKLPTPEKIIEQHQDAFKTLSKALPHVKIWPKSDADLQYILDLADKYRVYFSEGVRLLIRLAPLVINSPARNKRVDRWKAMAEIARAENVPLSHIAFLACLSATSAEQGFNPAQKLIKPKAIYTEEDAYNSMYDLFLIMLTNVLQTQAPELKVTLVTRDKNLAFFWMGLTFADPSSPGQQMIGLHQKLLPVSETELEELAIILGEGRVNPSWTVPPSLKY
ncbi:hypothetical protein [Pseudomonas sp. Root9]|jgi:hypothetical protein|uniref:hypothetical protein n=1 Tax=Pseudomonas sp. Root9 TaxID=1736604 RepID=UPI000A68EB06|nr:hypothetical protein [Pseudomonas sp. Root9]